MRLAVIRDTFTGRHRVATQHQDEETFWASKLYDKTELFKPGWDSLKYINLYWATLPMSAQDAIHELYLKARDVLQSSKDVDSLMRGLYPIVKTLLNDYHDLAEIEKWVRNKTDIVVPPIIQENMEFEAGSNITSEKTYLKQDYYSLLALAIACQSVIPIWCEFTHSVWSEVGQDFREWQAFRLLSHSKIWRSSAMEMLTRYVSLHTDKDGEAEAIIKGICRDDLPRFNTSSIMLRRVVIGDYSGHTAPFFINYIFNYIKQRNHNSKGFGRGGASARIRSKRDVTGERGEEELSALEGYKNQPKIGIGDSETMRFAASKPRYMADLIDPTIPDDKIKQCLEATAALMLLPLDRTQRTLAQWIGRSAIPARGQEELSKREVLSLIAVCQAAAWHWGHLHIAVLLTAIPDEEYLEHTSILADSYELSVANREIFAKLFPFMKGGVRGQSKKKTNVGIECIENFTSQLHKREWISYAPTALKAEHKPPILNAVVIDPYIRDLLAEVFLTTIRRRYPNASL